MRSQCKAVLTVLLTTLLASCSAGGPVKATREIKTGEKFFENWQGNTVGKQDSLVLLQSYSARTIQAGQEIKPEDVMMLSNLDIEWCKDTSFTSGTDPSMSLKLKAGNTARIEKDGKLVVEGSWSLEQKDAMAYLSLKLPGKPALELYGERSLTGDLRMLNTQAASGVPDQFWIESRGQNSVPESEAASQSDGSKKHGKHHRRKH